MESLSLLASNGEEQKLWESDYLEIQKLYSYSEFKVNNGFLECVQQKMSSYPPSLQTNAVLLLH